MFSNSGKLKWFAAAIFILALGMVFFFGIRSMRANMNAAAVSGISREEVNPIHEFKTLRQQLRSMQKAQLNDVAHSAQSDEELAAMAQRQLLLLCEREEDELTLEGILKIRGWKDPIVTVHEESVNVLVQAEMITQQESSVILELVCRETGIQSGNVKIIPIN